MKSYKVEASELVRFCALWHEGCGLARTKVLFRDKAGKEFGYWMDREVYNAIPLVDNTTLADYKKIGQVDEALNLDIYSNI